MVLYFPSLFVHCNLCSTHIVSQVGVLREQNNTENPATRASWINHRVRPNWLFFLFSSSSLNKQLVAKSTHTEMHFKIQGECVVSRFHIILCVLLGFSGFFSAYFFNALPHTRNVWGEKMVRPPAHIFWLPTTRPQKIPLHFGWASESRTTAV